MRYYSEDTVLEIMDAVEDAFSNYSWGRTYVSPKPWDYPSIEISEPHGRLIDVDRFMEDNADGFEMNWDDEKGDTIGRIFAPFSPVKKALDKAQTVLEASKER